jgi:hypothetical protein
VSYAAFKEGKAACNSNPYFKCRSKQDQMLFPVEITKNLYNETAIDECNKPYNYDRHAKIIAIQRYYRKMDKYNDFNIGA